MNNSDTKLNYIIEQKILEFFGDPDSFSVVRKDFIKKMKDRLNLKKQKLISHKQVLKKYGLN
ncbi:MAG: hypothetical protein UT65_C0002G0009 [Parcubacteria group bacterium GW2011_GWF2_39_8b]|uniref:Uncharacterized protein n=3 Tax=Candidatus Zambryskiibacteriota TaxID=1817925 RepID=A0A1G2T6C6_9BACT|nr:MAG: hypothetical protein UT65_C0002G0009 [Parcubacteria group bacterium GW2011_GWF2_39_8b]KKR46042.1 MAG: hypothetical protein UT81_C0003G0059 [Parcubacteria group bacterium GW2011_GWA2_40_14]OHA92722.1 MAG: hypothetical protein A2W58_00420 [Candidatus Zambryskibacteria bacterium RIFCSPHIGHO2_02_38_10.5]OHA98913.1 MAG: hypothetical protein A3E32_01255 [Candidatus Zambryskibacteria bacterium RIFCSPHIGHO2_12_FULL_38_37]OHB08504.1 MAG: hypothetical protein A2W64_03740 [Candidatus Zambryskibact